MDGFYTVFAALRTIMLEETQATGKGARHVVAVDDPGNLIVRTAAQDPATGQPGWFGTVTIKKSYVAFHLMPLYTDPGLADGMSEALAKRRQGKTCFNFRNADATLFDELRVLTRRAAGG